MVRHEGKQVIRIPSSYGEWLLDRGSLTQRLQASCDRFQIRLVCQGRATLSRMEQQFAGLPSQVLIREVFLLDGDLPLIYARSLLPPAALHGRFAALRHLGERPLGELLFEPGYAERTAMWLLNTGPLDLLYRHAVRPLAHPPARLWGRASRFQAGADAIVVSELFLPGIQEL